MMKFAIYDYLPQRLLPRATFEEMDTCRMILGFKDGRNVYSKWAAYQFANALHAVNLSDVAIVCIPASSKHAHVRRWKRFSQILCNLTGAQNGFDYVEIIGSRKRVHKTKDYELATNIKHCIHIDADFFKSRKVLVIDDIYTTGRSSDAFIGAMKAAGADVVMAAFLAKTKQFRRH